MLNRFVLTCCAVLSAACAGACAESISRWRRMPRRWKREGAAAALRASEILRGGCWATCLFGHPSNAHGGGADGRIGLPCHLGVLLCGVFVLPVAGARSMAWAVFVGWVRHLYVRPCTPDWMLAAPLGSPDRGSVISRLKFLSTKSRTSFEAWRIAAAIRSDGDAWATKVKELN